MGAAGAGKEGREPGGRFRSPRRSVPAGAVAIAPVLGLLLAPAADAQVREQFTTWTQFGGSSSSMQYSGLTQINKGNVGQLELAWFHPVPDRTGDFGFNPVVVDGVMYVLGEENRIVALEAGTGRVIWTHAVPGGGSPGQRGITYWESPDRTDRRLIYTAGGAIRQVNARTGEAITSFGDEGRVVMRVGEPRIMGGPSGTPGRVFENLFITGSNTGEGYFSPVGDLRAYDVITGELVWTFRTIPRPGDYGYETWPPEAWRYAGGANTWGEITIDEARGIAFFPTGSPTHDMFGGDRIGDNLFGNSIIALNARTGERIWHFQTVHHDMWDYDLTTAPKLLTVQHNGQAVDIVAQPSKHGYLYVFHRETGEPLWPIIETPMPASDVPGEVASPTQPVPTLPPPFARQEFGEEDINPYLDAEERAEILQRLRAARNEGVFTPIALDREMVMIPGQFGGSNWGGSAADPETGMLYVRTQDHPTIHQLREYTPPEQDAAQLQAGSESGALSARDEGLRHYTGTRYTGPLGSAFRNANRGPVIAPPWSEVVAYDLNDGTIRWRAPFGNYPPLAAQGITGTGNPRRAWRNGPVVTAGGLVFIGSWADRSLWAFDKDTGEVLWTHQLQANPDGIVAVFEVDGRQYVAFCASGSASAETPQEQAFEQWPGLASAQGYYVFALPR